MYFAQKPWEFCRQSRGVKTFLISEYFFYPSSTVFYLPDCEQKLTQVGCLQGFTGSTQEADPGCGYAHSGTSGQREGPFSRTAAGTVARDETSLMIMSHRSKTVIFPS